MVIESNGIRTDNYFIPPFELNEGEIIVIYLYGGAHYEAIKKELVDIFTCKTQNNNVKIFKPLSFVENITESKFRSLFFPMSVGGFLKKNANLNSPFASKIFDIDWVDNKTKIVSLPWTPRKLLSLYSTLSRTRDIIFDLTGQDPIGATETFDIVKESITNGGSAILIDWADYMRSKCTKFITIEWTKQ